MSGHTAGMCDCGGVHSEADIRGLEIDRLTAEVERLRGLLAHFRNRLLAFAPLADDMIAEMDAALSYEPGT